VHSYRCPHCDQLVFFENTECLRCGQSLGFDPATLNLVAFPGGGADGEGFRRCANQALARCNWLITDDDEEPLCVSCRLTRTRPSDSDGPAILGFADAEAAKRRMVFQILDIGLPLTSFRQAPGGLGYDLLSSATQPVITGHEDGIITIDLAESDDPHREQVRQDMGEAYRTMLGHVRHETGHYYWVVLVEHAGRLDRFRELFGDERADYGEAMNRHYERGAPDGWGENYVSAYATMHPWEDWAETFAHYLHIRDTLQTAAAFGMHIDAPEPELSADPSEDVEDEPFARVLGEWLPLTYALNAVNRSMGSDDLYPFVISSAVITKLTWVHATVRATARNLPITDNQPGPTQERRGPARRKRRWMSLKNNQAASHRWRWWGTAG
jgi:hypothetical protein